MTVLIVDSPLQEQTVQQLSLPDDVVQLPYPAENIGRADRAIYIASLDSGGTKEQKDILRNNPQVGEWFVLSLGTMEDSWLSFREGLFQVKSPIYTFSSAEELIKAMERPVVLKNSCLILSEKETPDADELIDLFKIWMPGWHFEKALLADDPEICFHTNCGKIIVIGRTAKDFQNIKIPEAVSPVVVMTRIEDNVLKSMHPQMLVQEILRKTKEFHWSAEILMQKFFIVSTAYEALRLRAKNEPDFLIALVNDSRFDMWDCYGLPESRKLYTKEHITDFLGQFDACERIASGLLNHNI